MFVYFLSHKTNWNFSHVLFSRTVADFVWDLLANFSTCWQRSICIILCPYSIFELVILVDDSKVFYFSCAKVLLHCENELSKMVEKTNTHTHYENGHTKTQTHAQSQFHFESFHTLTLLLFPFLLLHRTKYWGSSTNCHFELSLYMYIPLYRIYILRWVMKKSVPKELSNLNFFGLHQKVLKWFYVFDTFLSLELLLLLLLMLYTGKSTWAWIHSSIRISSCKTNMTKSENLHIPNG